MTERQLFKYYKIPLYVIDTINEFTYVNGFVIDTNNSNSTYINLLGPGKTLSIYYYNDIVRFTITKESKTGLNNITESEEYTIGFNNNVPANLVAFFTLSTIKDDERVKNSTVTFFSNNTVEEYDTVVLDAKMPFFKNNYEPRAISHINGDDLVTNVIAVRDLFRSQGSYKKNHTK